MPEVTLQEIRENIDGKSPYVQMGYLSTCLKKNISLDTRKFVLVNLVKVYEYSKMYLEAGKAMRGAADINTTFEGKSNDFMKSVELFIKGGKFDEADVSFSRAIACGNEAQKRHMKNMQKEFYKTQAKFYLQNDKRQNAVRAYEKLLTLELDEIERHEVREVLLGLYDKLGRIRDYYSMKRD